MKKTEKTRHTRAPKDVARAQSKDRAPKDVARAQSKDRAPKDVARAQSGQMAVELAVVLPVIFIVLVLAVDALTCAGECARFDQLASQAVLAQAVSPARGTYSREKRRSAVESVLQTQFCAHGMSASVEAKDAPSWIVGRESAFICTLEMAPWPLKKGGFEVFGTHVPSSFTHTCALAIDPYTPGKL